MASKAYQSRTDIEKLESQWRKLTGLHTREEWSAAVIRAATAAEIAANLAIRAEYLARSEFDADFVDSMLRWANGITGKFDRLLKPLWKGLPDKSKHFNALRSHVESINERRNAVAHVGEFCNKKEAEAVIENAEKLIVGLIALYEPQFKLKRPSDT
jgi:hypothetical protein